MCALPYHDRVIAMNRLNDVGIPALEATHRQAPEGPKVDHDMTSVSRVGEDARETQIAGAEFVNRVAGDGAEAGSPEDRLTRSGAWEHENVERVTAREGGRLVRHGAEVERIEIIGA